MWNRSLAIIKRIQKEGLKAIANTQKLSIADADAGDLGFGDGGNDGTDGTGEGPV